MQALGIDIGGSGIKGAIVETETGKLLTPRLRIPTPKPSKPRPVAEVVAEIAQHFGWKGSIGCGFPSVVQNGVVRTAANIHRKWINTNAANLFEETTGCPVYVINDADAAGLAEMKFGAGNRRMGVVMLLTIGSGIGSALFTDGHLVVNTEFGHLQMNGKDAERNASDAARKREKLTWKEWSKRFDAYLHALHWLFWPDLFILGGGVSKDFEKFKPYLTVETEVVPAQFLNEAGIVGAALAACTYLGCT